MKTKLVLACSFTFFIYLISACLTLATDRPDASQTPLEQLGEASPTSPITSVKSPPVQGTRIREIQGQQHRSPMDGETVKNVWGVVTALTGNGFFLQDPVPDLDVGTSEAVFVSYTNPSKLKVGDEIIIAEGKVREFNPKGIGANSLTITQISTSAIQVYSSKHPLPIPVVIGEAGRQIPNTIIDNDTHGFVSRDNEYHPEEDGIDFYESLESMLVQVNDALAVSTVNGYREFAVVANKGEYATVLSSTGALVIQNGDFNPEKIIIDDTFILMPDVIQGAEFTRPIVGIITYDFTNFRLSPTQKLVFTQSNLSSKSVIRKNVDSELSVATYNVENLALLQGSDRINRLAYQIVHPLGAPDILGLQEIQDNDGATDSGNTSANETLQTIIRAIQNAGGPVYRYMNVNPLNNRDGGEEGGNIRNVILYRTDRVSLPFFKQGDAESALRVNGRSGRAILSLNPGRIQPGSSAFRDSRKPIVGQFTFRNQDFYVIVNHFNSKGGDDPLYGDIQPPSLITEQQRTQQATVVNLFVAEILAVDPHASILVMGDLNDFYWSATLQQLSGTQLTNLTNRLEVNERFSYCFEGNAQALDHLLVSSALESRLTHVQVVHLNTSSLPEDQVSDHDPMIAFFDID